MTKINDLKSKTASQIVWNFTELMLRRGSSSLITIVLAWFLTSHDFGLIAMMAVFLALSNVLVDAGLSQALIRKQSVSASEYNTVFYANIGLALVMYGLLFGTAPIIADFYEEPSLEQLIRVAGLAIVFSAFSVVQRAILSRKLKFKLQMQVSLPSTILSGIVAIVLAYLDFGVWALVAQIIVQTLLNSVLYWFLKLWRPELEFNWKELVELFYFAGFLLLIQLTTVPVRYMYVIVIAKVFSAPIAGFYFFSQKIRDLLVDQLVSSVQAVTFPALAKLQEQPERLKNGYRQVVAVTTFMMFPILIFIAAQSENIFRFFLPETWWQGAAYLQLMCLAALMNPLHAINLNILKVKGRSDLVFYLGLFKKTVAVGIFAISFRYGITIILLGQILSSILAYLPNSYYSKQLIDYTVYEQLVDFVPGLLLAAVIGVVMWWIQRVLNWSPLSELVVLGGMGLLAYLFGAWLLKLRALDLVHELFNDKFKRKAV